MPYQLNTISSYSFYSSSLLIEDYVLRAKRLGYDGIGINDTNLYAFPSLASNCAKYGIKPIFGYHIQLLSTTSFPYGANLYILSEKGYLNFCKLISLQKNEYSIDILSEYQEGLALVLSTDEDFYNEEFLDEAKKDFYTFNKVFKDKFYFGITINSLKEKENATTLYRFIDDNDYHSLCFAHVEYLTKTDAYKTNILKLTAQKNKNIDNSKIEKEGPFFLLSPKVINSLYRQKEIEQTESFGKSISFEFFKKRGNLIRFENENEALKEKVYQGLKEKFKSKEIPQSYLKRADYELEIIQKMNFSSYFLLVEDYVKYAKQVHIKVGPGRGSAGGSLVAYLLDITKVDPIRFDLTFERFLNPKRVTMPDIDIDFEDERRNEIPQYLKRKYGEEHVCNIVTFVKLKPKSALNLIGPVLGVNENALKKLTSSISNNASTFIQAKEDPIKGKKFQQYYQDSYYKEICDIANGLLGLPVNRSIHAPGVIISEDPIYENCPLDLGKTGTVLYEYSTMEQLGFLKVDILSLNNLTFLKHIEEKITLNNKKIPNIYDDLDNKEVYKTLNDLDIIEIFQLDSSYGMRDAIKKINPNCFSDLASTISLYRPGPMKYIDEFAKRKHNDEEIVYRDKRLEPILKETYGIMIYQEQIMKAVQVLANFSLGEADLFRRAISKKKKDKIEAYKDKFIQGCLANNITTQNAIAIYNDIEKFAEYGFNKSHGYSYALITYSLLYYKTFYPEEFYLTCLESESFNTWKITEVIQELKKRDYRLKVPHIFYSDSHKFIIKNKDIYLPLSFACSKDDILTNIIQERNKTPYSSYYDFIKRNQNEFSENNIKVLYDFIDSGCFDCFSKSRVGMKENAYTYLNFAHFDFDEKQITPITDSGEDIGEMLYLEKMILGRILSCQLEQLFSKPNYQTFIVTDTSQFESSHILQVDNETNTYKFKYDKKDKIQKYDFIMLKGFFKRRTTFIQPEDIIICKRKVVKHE